MNSELFLKDLEAVGAVITNSHMVYTSWKHGSAYVNKDDVYPHVVLTSQLCREIARAFRDDDIEVVVAPAVGGVVLTQWITAHLSEMTGRGVIAVYAEPEERLLLKAEKAELPFGLICTDAKDRLPAGASTGMEGSVALVLTKGAKLVAKQKTFVFNRGYAARLLGKRTLVVEDVLNTGGSALEVVLAARKAGANVVAVGALCNRGGVTTAQLGDVPKLFALIDVKLDAWEPQDCPLCKAGVPINTTVGKGREFLAQQGK